VAEELQITTYVLNTKQREDLNLQQEGGHLKLLKRRKDLQQQLKTAEKQQRHLQGQVGINKDNKRKLQISSIDQFKNPSKRPYRTLAHTSQGTAKEIAIQLDDQHQDKTKRRTAEHLQRNKKIGATIQNENEEYTCYDMESDEENEHESEQERKQRRRKCFGI
jgi:hypothetical protein